MKRDKCIENDSLFGLLYSHPKAKLATAEDLIANMDAQEIDISVVLNINWSSFELCRENNDYILEVISKYPRRLIGFGMVVLDRVDNAIEEIERCSKNGVKGIGEIRPTDELLNNEDIRPVIQSIIDNHLVLLTHASEPVGHVYPGKGNITPDMLYRFIMKFPELKLVCAHWGGGLPFYALMPEVKKALENVFFDSAASPFLYHPQVYWQVAQLTAPQKVLFGSDYPLIPPKRLLTEIERLNLSPEFKRQLLAENARSLLEFESLG